MVDAVGHMGVTLVGLERFRKYRDRYQIEKNLPKGGESLAPGDNPEIGR